MNASNTTASQPGAAPLSEIEASLDSLNGIINDLEVIAKGLPDRLSKVRTPFAPTLAAATNAPKPVSSVPMVEELAAFYGRVNAVVDSLRQLNSSIVL